MLNLRKKRSVKIASHHFTWKNTLENLWTERKLSMIILMNAFSLAFINYLSSGLNFWQRSLTRTPFNWLNGVKIQLWLFLARFHLLIATTKMSEKTQFPVKPNFTFFHSQLFKTKKSPRKLSWFNNFHISLLLKVKCVFNFPLSMLAKWNWQREKKAQKSFSISTWKLCNYPEKKDWASGLGLLLQQFNGSNKMIDDYEKFSTIQFSHFRAIEILETFQILSVGRT